MIDNPLLLWMCAVTVATIGVRRRRPVADTGGRSTAGILRVFARIPSPAGLRDRALGERLRRDLVAGAIGDAATARVVAGARAGLVTVGVMLGAVVGVIAPVGVLLGLGVAVCGWTLPAAWAARRADERRRALVRELPDVIDVVVLCADAGLALEPALRHAARRLEGVCAEEVRVMLAQLDLGTPRREAYRALAARTGTTELTGLVSALLQAEELGTPINAALARQAELLRANRRQAIRDRSARAAPKVQMVVAMVMVPASLLLIVGVMVIQLIGQVGGVVGGAP